MRVPSWLRPIISVFIGLALGLIVVAFAGENPFHVALLLLKSAVGSRYDIGMTLFYATPLIFTGLSVAIAFHSGLFNIGAEGQLTLGALAAAAAGIYFPDLPPVAALLLGGASAFGVGALWGAIPGWLKVKRGSHEVINTIMLNFIAAGLASYITLYVLKNPESQNPETKAVGAGYILSAWPFFGETPVSAAFVVALLFAFLVYLFLWKTVPGFRIRAVGQNEEACKVAGIRADRAKILAMTLAGGMAGLVGIGEVFGNAHRFRLGFSPDFGFIGIAVALLGRNHPAGVVGAALLFGALHKGAGDLDLETEKVTRDLSLILQALIILSVSAVGIWDFLPKRRKSNE